ncbi:restriction endonuclease subunit S [Bacteroides gallinaceum]|uniref:restriction endonuclease subunit S n=1 Tax=Bacteroides gallinaceum TaxID=1462571 RepID=UPI00195EAD4F|nr:restriction endonuclease subunit S [Bacteroides gallinaceum]MBM6719277.1 restriction endonuclease subunit S [Bacteroides gallinaceum]
MKETRFKQTEIGLIPEDWKIISLEEIGEPKMCKRILKNQTFIKGDIPFYKIGTFGGKADAYISKSLYEYYKKKFSFPQKGDVLISAAGTIGRLVIYQGEDAYYQDSNIVWIDNKEEKLLNQYLYYTLKNTSWDTSQGTIQRLYNASLKAKQIIIPLSINEQKKIASALTSIDNLLLSLDKLIEKKRLIKQGAMQELLTGKKRLPGFTGEWVEKKLGEGLRFKPGFPFNSNFFDERMGIRLIRNRDLKADDQITYFYGNINKDFIIENGDLLIGMDGDFMPCLWNKGKALLNQRVGKIELISNNWCLMYLFYALQEPLKAKQEKTGATTVKHLSHSDIEQMRLKMPSTSIEQKVIGKILSSMDKGIESLEGKKAKYEQIKQGMMQQLLTGKIRLIS